MADLDEIRYYSQTTLLEKIPTTVAAAKSCQLVKPLMIKARSGSMIQPVWVNPMKPIYDKWRIAIGPYLVVAFDKCIRLSYIGDCDRGMS